MDAHPPLYICTTIRTNLYKRWRKWVYTYVPVTYVNRVDLERSNWIQLQRNFFCLLWKSLLRYNLIIFNYGLNQYLIFCCTQCELLYRVKFYLVYQTQACFSECLMKKCTFMQSVTICMHTCNLMNINVYMYEYTNKL